MKKADILQRIADTLIEREETVSIAESVTGGLMMARLTLAKEATQFFQGGITAYNIGQKTRQLSVDPVMAEKTNCVSDEVSKQMAIHVARQFCSQWGVGITGYAVPVPTLKIRKCFAFVSISYQNVVVVSSRIDTEQTGQRKVQNYFADETLRIFLNELNANMVRTSG